MSSFVINKEEYIKAAGVVAALQNDDNFRAGRYGLYLWNLDEGKKLNTEDVYKMFTNFFKLNADSVKKQYNDPEEEKDYNEYKPMFNLYYDMTSNFIKMGDYNSIERLVYGLLMFSRSVDYQIEDKEDNDKVMKEFNNIITRAFNLIADNKYRETKPNYWGSFNYS